MSLTFNIADLHGRSDLAKMAVDAIHKYSSDKDNTIIFTGDYIDRGPDSKGVIEFIKDLQENNHDNIVALKGNHETFLEDAYINPQDVLFWVSINGGAQTYRSYDLDPFNPDKNRFPEEHVRWISGLPLVYDDGKRLYVHAGVDHSLSLKDQVQDTLIWKIYGQDRIGEYADGLEDTEPFKVNGPNDLSDFTENVSRHVVHGHHQFEDGPKLFTNRSNFDTLAWYTGRLVVGVFDNDKKGGPIDKIEVLGPSYKELKEHEYSLSLR